MRTSRGLGARWLRRILNHALVGAGHLGLCANPTSVINVASTLLIAPGSCGSARRKWRYGAHAPLFSSSLLVVCRGVQSSVIGVLRCFPHAHKRDVRTLALHSARVNEPPSAGLPKMDSVLLTGPSSEVSGGGGRKPLGLGASTSLARPLGLPLISPCAHASIVLVRPMQWSIIAFCACMRLPAC